MLPLASPKVSLLRLRPRCNQAKIRVDLEDHRFNRCLLVQRDRCTGKFFERAQKNIDKENLVSG